MDRRRIARQGAVCGAEQVSGKGNCGDAGDCGESNEGRLDDKTSHFSASAFSMVQPATCTSIACGAETMVHKSSRALPGVRSSIVCGNWSL